MDVAEEFKRAKELVKEAGFGEVSYTTVVKIQDHKIVYQSHSINHKVDQNIKD